MLKVRMEVKTNLTVMDLVCLLNLPMLCWVRKVIVKLIKRLMIIYMGKV